MQGSDNISSQLNWSLPGWTLQRGISISPIELQSAERELWRDQLGQLAVSESSQAESTSYRIRLIGQVAVDVAFSQRLLVERPASSAISTETLDHFLADQVLPRILAHEGRLVLHAGAIKRSGSAIVFLGQSGRGKSTLVASLDQAGFTLIGDDALIVSREDQAFCIRAVYPSLRLLPDSLEALFQHRPATSEVAHYSSKQRIDVPIAPDHDAAPLPIAAIFSLAEPSLDGEIRLRPMSPAETCIALITNSFALDPTDRELGRKKLEDASRLANAVPAFEISYPRDYARLPDVHAAIFKQVAETGLAKP